MSGIKTARNENTRTVYGCEVRIENLPNNDSTLQTVRAYLTLLTHLTHQLPTSSLIGSFIEDEKMN